MKYDFQKNVILTKTVLYNSRINLKYCTAKQLSGNP